MHCAICWNFLEIYGTNSISLSSNTLALLVKILSLPKNNQPVTKGVKLTSHLVGTSETTRATSSSKEEIIFNQWLAGLIDGDGCFLVTKQGYTSCEITVALNDERLLRIIQNKLGGSIKPRSGVQAIRWRMHNKIGMIILVTRINGYIRHSRRLLQLNKVCTVLDIPLLSPDQLSNTHGWFSGFFDADGTINYYLKGKYLSPQLTLSVTNKLYIDIIYFMDIFGGNIYFDKAQNGYYKYSIQSEKQLGILVDYFKLCPSRSIKSNRIFLVKQYYKLIALKAHKAPEGTVIAKAWVKFNLKWNSTFSS